MIAKLEFKTDTIESLDQLVEDYRRKCEKEVGINPSLTYTMFVNEENLTFKVKILDIGTQIN